MKNSKEYYQAMEEFLTDRDSSLWAAALERNNGDADAAQSDYVNSRTKQLKGNMGWHGSKESNFGQFEESVQVMIGTPLSSQMREITQEFWNHKQRFCKALNTQELRIGVDPLILIRNVPEYSTYSSIKGAGKLLMLLALPLVFFHWTLTVGLFLLGMLLFLYGNKVGSDDSKKFADSLLAKINEDQEQGLTGLCAAYLTGIISLIGFQSSAMTPDKPTKAFS